MRSKFRKFCNKFQISLLNSISIYLTIFTFPVFIRFAVILAFDVKIERDAQEMADSVGVKIFQADIIYHLFDSFMKYRDELKKQKRDEFKDIAVFPCKLRILPQVNNDKFIF